MRNFLAVLILLAGGAAYAVKPTTYEESGIPREGYWTFHDNSDSSAGLNEGTVTIQGRMDSFLIHPVGNDIQFENTYTTTTANRNQPNVVRSSVTRVLADAYMTWRPLEQMFDPWIVFRQLTAGTTVYLWAEYSQSDVQLSSVGATNVR